MQKERRATEAQQLREAAALFQMEQKKGLPCQPSEDGFVFSTTQIETYIRRHHRLKAAHDSGFAYYEEAAALHPNPPASRPAG